MQVSPVKFSQTQNFKGLWGQEKTSSDYGQDMGSETIDRYYYPFKDETSREIDAVKKKYTKNSYNLNGGQYTIDYFENCHIEDKLGFTKREWEQYSRNKSGLKPVVKEFIESSLKMFDLKHYLK